MDPIEEHLENRVKVCHLTMIHFRNDPRIFHRECRSLAEKGYETILLVQDHLKGELRAGVKIASVGSAKSTFVRLLWKHPRMLWKALRTNADIYQIHDPELLIVGLLIRLSGRIVVYDIHENTSAQLEAAFRFEPLKRLVIPAMLDFLERFSAKWFSGLVVTNPVLNSKFSRLNRKTVNVRNFPTQIFRDGRKTDTGEMNLVYIGLISEARGIWQIMDLLLLIPNGLILAGVFISEDLRSRIQRHEAWRKVIYHGYVDMSTIPGLLRESDIGLCTLLPTKNHMNTYALKMFEYMAMGLPILVSAFPLWADIVERHHCGIVVDPENLQEMADAIRWLNTNKEEAIRMGIRGEEAVTKHYNWCNEFERLTDLYRELL